MAKRKKADPPRRVFGPVLLIVLCLFVWASLVTFDVGDWPSTVQSPHNSPAHNACGPAGAVIAYALNTFLGDGTYPLMIITTLGIIVWIVRGTIRNLGQRAFGTLLLVVATSAAVHVVVGDMPGTNSLPMGDGGLVGYAVGRVLNTHLYGLGTLLILGCSILVGLAFATEGWVFKLPEAARKFSAASGTAFTRARTAAAGAMGEAASRVSGGTEEESSKKLKKVKPKINVNRPRKDKKKKKSQKGKQPELFDEQEEEEKSSSKKKKSGKAAATAKASSPATADEAEGPAEDPILRVLNSNRRQVEEPVEPYPKEITDWTFPSIKLLAEPEYTFTKEMEERVRAKADVLEKTLDEFRIECQVVQIETGPVITMYELQIAPGVKVSRISSLADDIARALKAPNVRVVAPLPGKNTIGIEVPNTDRETVRLRELMMTATKASTKMTLPLYLGKDVSGAALVTDLTKMPHMLIAGTTGSGKSVCINSIISSILMTKRPDQVKMIMVDPKMVEMSLFKEVPHLMCPIVTDMGKAESILEWAVTKMEERYALLSEARVKNIASYNMLTKEQLYERIQPVDEEEKNQIAAQLPYVVIIIDELADLMMTAAKEVETHLSRLAQKSRAVGIHIVVATQRPEAKVVTGLIKSNLPCRAAFRVASRLDSRIVLDQSGAEVLMGQGDMLFLPPGKAKPERAQGTYMDDEELHRLITFLGEQGEPQFHPELMKIKSHSAGSDKVRDPLFEEAVIATLETQRGSVSLLQRRLKIGYGRASRLVDEMADAGIIGPYKGSQAREVLMTLDEWEKLQKELEKARMRDQKMLDDKHAADKELPFEPDIEGDDLTIADVEEEEEEDEDDEGLVATAEQEDEDEIEEDDDEEDLEDTEEDEEEEEDDEDEDDEEEEDDDNYEYEYVEEEDEDEDGDEEDEDEDGEYEYEYVEEEEEEEEEQNV